MIEPGKGTSRYRIGDKLHEMDFSDVKIIELEDRESLKVYKSKEIWFFFDTKTEELDQLSLFAPFQEKVLGKVGIGDKLADVYLNFGKCCINHKVHEPFDYPGIAFETENGSKSKDAIIETISVLNPYKLYADIPQHIANNLPGNKRKLP